MKKQLLIVLLILFSGVFHSVKASHSVGVDISYTCIGVNQYEFEAIVYRDCEGMAQPSSITLNINSASCGVNTSLSLSRVSVTNVSQVCASSLPNTSCNGGSLPGIEQHVYRGTITLPFQCSDWIISYSTCCRNANITNLQNPSSQDIYAEAHLNNLGGLCNSSPKFNSLPTPYICVGQPFSYSQQAVDPDGNTLVYTLVNPQSSAGNSIAYSGGNTPTNPMSVTGAFGFNSTTGLMTFTPSIVQQGAIAILVEEFDGLGNLVGSTTRELQVVVINCSNDAPTLSGVDNSTLFDYEICAGGTFCFDVISDDINGGNVTTLTWDNGIPGGSFNSSGSPFETGTFCWTTTAGDVGTHFFSVTVEDDACPIVGLNTYVYQINVTPGGDAPVNPGPNQQVCQGDLVSLNATAGVGAVFSWSPTTGLSDPNIANPTLTAVNDIIYSVTASYPSGCNQVGQIAITVQDDPAVSVFPQDVSVCAGSNVFMTATGDNTGLNYEWFDGVAASLGTGTVSGVNSDISATVGTSSTTFTVTVTDPSTGCTSDEIVNVTVGDPPPTEVCSNIYVSTTGTVGGAASQADPVTLEVGISMALCNNSTIKMATGTYNIDNPLNGSSFVTIEGGFIEGSAWSKTSTPGATTIFRTTANPEGTVNNQRLVAMYFNSASFFRFQDITIEVADANLPGESTYALHMVNCSDYDIVRCQIISGDGGAGDGDDNPLTINTFWDGSNGINGSNGNTGTAGESTCGFGADDGGTGGNGGGSGAGAASATGLGTSGTGGSSGGRGGDGRDDNNSSPGIPGTAGTGISPGGGGAGGARDGNNGPTPFGGPGGVGGDGTDGTDGITIPGTIIGGFYQTSQSSNGTVGTGGSGGGGGGGCGEDTGGGCDAAGGGGSGGGGGGGGAGAGKGAFSGGSSFAMFITNNGVNANIIDSDITAGAPGAGGIGGSGGSGGNGGISFQGAASGDNQANRGGVGGFGGAGGDGGNGGDGAIGLSFNVYAIGSTPTLIQNGGTIAIASDGDNPTNFNLPTQPIIEASNVSCSNTNIDFSSAAGSATWNLGATATPLAPVGANVTTQYTGLGRKDIDYGADTYSGFVNITLNGTTSPSISTTAPIVALDTFVVCVGQNADFATPSISFDVLSWDFGGAIAPNTYLGNNLTGLTFSTPGTYTVTLTASSDCCGAAPDVTIVLIVDDVPTLALTGSMSICDGESTTLTATTNSDSLLWSPFLGLSADTGLVVTFTPPATTNYVVTAYSTFGVCSETENFTVTLNEIDLSVSSTPTICTNDGSATVVASAGSGTYAYSWDDPSSQATATATNLFSGNHQVVVTDQITGCVDSIFAFVDPGTSPVVYTSDLQQVACSGDNSGSATAAVVNGNAPITYTWTNTDVPVLVTSGVGVDNVSSLAPGNYNVSIIDNLGCTHTTDFIISEPDTVLYAIDVLITEPTCFGTADGAVTVTADGGSGGYTYQWDAATSNQTGPTASGLDTGAYVLTITDDNVCTIDTTITLTVPGNPLIINAGANDTICGDTYTLAAIPTSGNTSGEWVSFIGSGTAVFNNSTSGTSDVTVSGGFGTYTLEWREDNGAGCVANETVDITFIENPISDAGLNDASCRLTGYTLNGVASVGDGSWTFTGPGTATFTPNINTANAQVDVDVAGNYDFTWTETNVIGSFNCTDNSTVTISFTDLTFSATPSDALCGVCNGQVVMTSASASGFALNGGVSQVSGTFTSLCSGPQTITIENAIGCSIDTNVTIGAPTTPTIIASGTDTICIGETTILGAQAAGGDGNYTYNWDNGLGTTQNPSVSPTATIEYMVTVTDGNVCTSTPDSVTITVDQVPDVSAAGGDQLACDTLAFVQLAGSTPVVGVGSWSILNGGGTFNDVTDPNAQVSNAPVGLNEYIWTISNGVCPVETDNVILETEVCLIELIIPNVFTPNGDGINDNFTINRPILDGVIYNRWGQTMYQYVGTKGYWDGRTSAGVEVPAGTYYFSITIQATSSTTEVVKGHMMLVR